MADEDLIQSIRWNWAWCLHRLRFGVERCAKDLAVVYGQVANNGEQQVQPVYRAKARA